MESLKEKTAKGLFWGAMNSGVTQLLNLVIGVFLGRLLAPADYGMVAVLSIFTLIAGNLQSCGFTQGLANIRKPAPDDYNSVFWFNILVSLSLYILLFFSAPLIAVFFHQPALVKLSRFTFLAFVISSFGIAHNAFMYKNMMNKERAVVGATALLVSGVCGITLALCGYAYWSLAWQQVIYILTANIGRYVYTYKLWHPVMKIDFAPVKRMFGFSVKLLVTSVINTVGTNILTFIFGRYLPVKAVGNYTQANKWSAMGGTMISGMIDYVAQPVLVEAADDDAREKRVFRKMLRFAAFLSFPAMFGLGMTAFEFIVLLLTDKWADSVPLLRLLCMGGAFAPFYTMFQQLLVSKGRSDIYLVCSLLQVFLQVAVIMLFIDRGVTVMTAAFSAFYVIYLSVWFLMSKKLVGISCGEVAADVLPFAAAALAVTAAVWFATESLSPLFVRLLVRIVLTAVLYAAVMKAARVKILDECIDFISVKFKKKDKGGSC